MSGGRNGEGVGGKGNTGGTDKEGGKAARRIDGRIAALGDWRGRMLAGVRALIKEAEPLVVEEWKCGVRIWSCRGILCTGETYKAIVKPTFPKGTSLAIPADLRNVSLKATRSAPSTSPLPLSAPC